MPCSSSEVDKYQLLKRKAHESIQHLLSEHRSPEKRRKPDTDKFLNEYKDNLRTFQVYFVSLYWHYKNFSTLYGLPVNLIRENQHNMDGDRFFVIPSHGNQLLNVFIARKRCQQKQVTPPAVMMKHTRRLSSLFILDRNFICPLRKIRQDLSNSHRLTCIYRSSKVDFKYLYRYSQDFINDVIELAPSYKMELCLENVCFCLNFVNFFQDCIASLGTLHYENYSRNCLILAGLHWKMQITEWGSTVMYCNLCDKECFIS